MSSGDTSGPSGLSGRDFPEPPGLRVGTPIWVGRRSQWFEARQVRLDRTVAVKFLRPHLAADESFREAFLAAGRQAAVIVHPAALPVINVFRAQNCIAMQYCVSKSLQELGPDADPAILAGVGWVVMDCLSALHATGRCHGNLSAGNIFADGAGGVWLGDFFQPPVSPVGGSLFVADRAATAPEVLAGGAPDWRADVYSLATVLARALRPGSGSDELGMLLDALRSGEAHERSGSPQAVYEAFGRIKRLEDLRRGRKDGERQRAKRMYRRVPAAFEVSLRKRSATPEETAVILMKTRDIGESGVFVETDDDHLVVGSILELDFTLRGVEGNVHAFGIVRWRSSPPMARGVGVQFVEVDQAGLARLREFLGRREESNRNNNL